MKEGDFAMNIQQIESKTGLDRSNIRFYEREGLVVPQRLENGYRDYSEDDLILLKKIKLLRRLDFGLTEIRELMSGSLSMDRAIESRLAAIQERRRELNAAESVCLSMQEDGVTFSTLDAEKYLSSFDRAMTPSGIRPTVPPADRIVTPAIPWRRFFARSLDVSLMTMFLYALMALLFRWNINRIMDLSAADWLVGLTAWGLLIPAEAFCLSRFGTTPGKWVLGIRIEHIYGRKLTFAEACDRTFHVFYGGEGCTIPLYNLYKNYQAYKTLTENQELAWDFNCQFVVKDFHPVLVGEYFAVTVLAAFLTFTASLVPALPQHKGAVSAEEFVENFNRLSRYHRLVYQLEEATGEPGVLTYKMDDPEDNASSTYARSPIYLVLQEENGVLVSVSYERDVSTLWSGPYFDPAGQKAMLLSTQAFAWTEAGLYSAPKTSGIIEDLINHDQGLFTADLFGTTVSYQVDDLGQSMDESFPATSYDYHVAFSLRRNA